MLDPKAYHPNDVFVMRQALDDWCARRRIEANSREGHRIALRILDLMKGERLTRTEIFMRLAEADTECSSRRPQAAY
ncbi:hypothetical protein [Ensifer sp. MJa1]|uniref:hypothetical protein n=1 Tax=Ensifer sp. MJa1 TaxID=2919888 RepID=UPI003009B64C